MRQSRQRMVLGVRGRARQVGEYVRRSPGSRSIMYFGTAALIVEVVAHIQDRTHPYALVREHLVTLPIGAAFTYACVCLRPEDRARWNRVPLQDGVAQSLRGAGLGSGAFLGWLGIAAAKGWVSAPTWGWDQESASAVARSVALLGVGHLAVVWNEEMVFRGYGFDTLREAIGGTAAIIVSVLLFAVYHGLEYQRLLGMVVGGMALTLMRLERGNLWFPYGFHLAWNIWQVAIFGPADGPISVRPLRLHGPRHWVGKPGEPEPGRLSILVLVAIAMLVGLRLWRRSRSAGATQ